MRSDIRILQYLLRWAVISLLIGLLAGAASAALLASLDWATAMREANPWLIALLPLAGFAIGWLYHQFGKSVEAGNNLLLDEIHDPRATVPARMAPLVLLGTAVSHLFGASVGREGTALQMGASLADQLTKPLRLDASERRILLMAGIAAGFASVFGTPLAGAVFGLEVLAIGAMRYDALIPCFLSAAIADRVTIAIGLHHTPYRVPFAPPLDAKTLLAAVAAGIAFGLTARAFAWLSHSISRYSKVRIAYGALRPVVGGTLVAAAVYLVGTRYIGLGIPVISESFLQPVHSWDFAAKVVFTAVSLGFGFKGGEVTPLFYIGATLGNALGNVLPLPMPLLAGMGFVAVFGGAANTPLASTLMAIELFGGETGLYAGLACVVSYLFSGHAGIYTSQRSGTPKSGVL